MSSQTRTLLIVLALAFAGVSGLAFMAHRYGKIVEARKAVGPAPRPASNADVLVERFIVVRRAVRQALDEVEGRTPRVQDLAMARERALAAAGMDTSSYLSVRRVYRAWRDGRERKGTPLANAFEARREVLLPLDLGEYEQLD